MPAWMEHLWLIPMAPLLAAGVLLFVPSRCRALAAGLATGALALAFVAALGAFLATVGDTPVRWVFQRDWFTAGTEVFRVGWILDPLSASMILMVTGVGTVIFAFSASYMAHDPRAVRFFGFLSLFAAAMLGLVLSNHLLVLFMCWEVVGLASFLLIGFWFDRPAAAAAARKAFLTTRIGDLGFLVGLVWLQQEAGTLLAYDDGAGCLEQAGVARLVATATVWGLPVSAAISLLFFCGAVGKSGQIPLHVWLPDAMEGPTPVSALIHAATMVAAGVFLMARIHPLVAAGGDAGLVSAVITWTGALTALMAAAIAVAQSDLKRILAYSTVSQLGFMFVGLGTGGPAVALFHLLTHAVFKALLFLGAGSVIHGCHGEQDIRRMGGLRRAMPVTFATYAVGMMALSGVPLVFSGFWSKDAILLSSWEWSGGRGPFAVVAVAAALTAFYMARQVWHVFLRPAPAGSDDPATAPHESPAGQTVPLAILAAATLLLTVVATPLWPWLEHYLSGASAASDAHGAHGGPGAWVAAGVSVLAVATGFAVAAAVYRGRRRPGTDRPGVGAPAAADAVPADPLAVRFPRAWAALAARLGFDEFHAATSGRVFGALATLAAAAERSFWNAGVLVAGAATRWAAVAGRLFEEDVMNGGTGALAGVTRWLGRRFSRGQQGPVQGRLRWVAAGVVILLGMLGWWRAAG